MQEEVSCQVQKTLLQLPCALHAHPNLPIESPCQLSSKYGKTARWDILWSSRDHGGILRKLQSRPMSLKNEERDSADKCKGTKITHQDTERLNLARVIAIGSQRGCDADCDGVEDSDKSGSNDVYEIIQLFSDEQ